jgi:hypothetical protein
MLCFDLAVTAKTARIVHPLGLLMPCLEPVFTPLGGFCVDGLCLTCLWPALSRLEFLPGFGLACQPLSVGVGEMAVEPVGFYLIWNGS